LSGTIEKALDQRGAKQDGSGTKRGQVLEPVLQQFKAFLTPLFVFGYRSAFLGLVAISGTAPV
jgi:hypothetical protein